MRNLSGSVAIVTGASRGIGVRIAHGLARRGVRLALAARSAVELEAARDALKALGCEAIAVPTDVTDGAALDLLVARTLDSFGAIDILINNAAVAAPSAYERLSLEEVERHIAINLMAPMALTHKVLPFLLARDRGHIVNVASLAGLTGVALGETYSATKHGLMGFTRALRASCRLSGSQVSASAICPGFVEDVGMYARHRSMRGRAATLAMGTSPSEAVVAAVVKAIEKDRPEVIVSPRPLRIFLALEQLWPGVMEGILRKLEAHRVFASAAEAAGLEGG